MIGSGNENGFGRAYKDIRYVAAENQGSVSQIVRLSQLGLKGILRATAYAA
jgi:hypothetical protein